MGRGVGGRSRRRGGRSGRSERANALPEGGAAAKRERAPLPSLFLRATPAPPPRRPSPLRARPPQPRAPEARAVGGVRRLRGPMRAGAGARCAPWTSPAASQRRLREERPTKNMRRGVRQTARAGEVKSNRIRAKQTAGSVRFARGRSGYFRPRRRRGAPREGA